MYKSHSERSEESSQNSNSGNFALLLIIFITFICDFASLRLCEFLSYAKPQRKFPSLRALRENFLHAKFAKIQSIFFLSIILTCILCININEARCQPRIRGFADTIGYATKDWQMNEFMNLIKKEEPEAGYAPAKLIISPHDDNAYVKGMYNQLLSQITARKIIFIGVCHKAKQFGLENKLIFDDFTHWSAPFGSIPVSDWRNKILAEIPESMYQINDSAQALEHSVEGILSILQYFNRNIEFVSILVPYSTLDRMKEMAGYLAKAITKIARDENAEWGRDFAIVISNDAVHYGDEGWGGKNFAQYGTDTSGYKLALEHEHAIINSCLTGNISIDKIENFVNSTVKESDFREYKWTWCGRYSVPLGLLTSYYLQDAMSVKLSGSLLNYSTSIEGKPLDLSRIGMGTTAPANLHHWVGYAAVVWR
ncbi:MAG: AmmeMemoRadiSam system protein [Ignavibacteria bacterium]|nr:AmmeMemoRadiSam system protein [Ignavibacteria bacterium]